MSAMSPISGIDALGEIYCVSFVRGLSPEEALRRFGIDEETLEEGLPFDELDERSAENMPDDGAGYVAAAKVGDWTVIVEPGGWRLAADSEKFRPVSRGTELVAVCRHDYAEDSFAYIVDGTPALWFDPARPEDGSEHFTAMMNEVGFSEEDPMGSSFALAARITGLGDVDLRALSYLGADPDDL